MPHPHPADADVKTDGEVAPQPKPRSYGLNRWTLLGRMTADPEVRYTPGGKAVLTFRLATTIAGAVSFHRLTAWERSAEVLGQYGRKGRELLLEGRLSPRVREVEGHRVEQVDLVVETFHLLGKSNGTAAEEGER